MLADAVGGSAARTDGNQQLHQDEAEPPGLALARHHYQRARSTGEQLGFIVFAHLPESGEHTVKIDFGVIEKGFDETGDG